MRCAACPGKAVHVHHLIPRQVLKREGYQGRMDDPRNLMDLCFDCHMSHENWSRRLTRDQLPAGAWEFARELGEWAVCRVERDYPSHERSTAAAGTARA